MKIAIIVVACLLGVGLIGFFIALALVKYGIQRKHGAPKSAFFTNIKKWLIAHKPSKRRLIQLYAAVLFNANIKGYITGDIYTSKTTKYACVPGLNCYSCPGAVGACPMGALQNALSVSGTRAPYYVLGILAIFGIMLGRTICGFLCPVGLCQELVYKVRTPKLKKNRVTRIFSYFKYVILALTIALPIIFGALGSSVPAFCKYICPAGTFEGAVLLLANPNSGISFSELGWLFTWKFSLAIALIVASVFIFRFFCRFICPLGAIYGFFNRYALIGVKVNDDSCINCGLCIKHCKMDTKHVGDHECINCGECISVCPTKAISWKGSQIFLHKNAVAEQAPTVAPISVKNGKVKIEQSNFENNENKCNTVEDCGTVKIAQNGFENNAFDNNAVADNSVANNTGDTVMDNASAVESINEQMSVCTPITAIEAAFASENSDSGSKTSAKKRNLKFPKKSRKFWIEVTAWVLALSLLVAALVCYNFVDVEKPYTPDTPPVGSGDEPPIGENDKIGFNVGDIAPNFTVNLYGEQGGTFNLYENRGKIIVINFWGTWCGPCVEELPFFNMLAENYADKISVVAIHGLITDAVQPYIKDTLGWNNWQVTFAQDDMSSGKAQVFTLFGGKNNAYPLTVVVDEEGRVTYNDGTSIKSYDDLETKLAIKELLAEKEESET